MIGLRADAQRALDELHRNNDSGNRYILLPNLPRAIRIQLDKDKNMLDGIPFRLTFEGRTGVMKIIPSYTHGVVTRRIADEILFQSMLNRTPEDDIGWAATTTFRSTTRHKGKQPDDCFLPATRQGRGGDPPKSPTLVLESGVLESLPRLHEDVKWWFQNSSGAVRIVLVFSIDKTRRTILLEKWQRRSADRMLHGINQMPISMPAMDLQDPELQQLYVAQSITITSTSVVGSVPLSLHFESLFDRAPQSAERDLQLDVQRLVDIAQNL
ncbi:hypothetical protein ASPZODRAFT_1961593 [Penicilliopsis zonata CBS 506.65]|uniref:Uncharacterized protein n=1 Tax=Penicilliopsis zonata CBS 506.65 TaxID=1073090 RepID=A0A1L9SGY7_9EURO|nr:hypothetical protein ASPZODRAFT_1961593 [Penicilliopsis zonata CBS 506.65]OJJ46408.1 hypothetical protein ASPZODRAFT_1961593 [Penicilliopsis zonata CBS 506.65]